jgi:hypothetical protein
MPIGKALKTRRILSKINQPGNHLRAPGRASAPERLVAARKFLPVPGRLGAGRPPAAHGAILERLHIELISRKSGAGQWTP